MDQTPLKRPQFFFTTAPLPCPYLTDRLERKLVTELSGTGAETVHEALVAERPDAPIAARISARRLAIPVAFCSPSLTGPISGVR
mgnify:CR=1 FL=1